VEDVAQRLTAVEHRLDRLESLLLEISGKLEHRAPDPTPEAIEGLKHWVTDFVALRLQQLVPETCEHPPELDAADGPYLEGTDVRCTEDVVHRVKRIPIPFVRQTPHARTGCPVSTSHSSRRRRRFDSVNLRGRFPPTISIPGRKRC
jgi:hypothetical protein